MKVKLDENLPTRLRSSLRQRGHDVDTVATEGLTGQADRHVWAAAVKDGRFLITQDMDFSDVRVYRPGEHAGLMLVRPEATGCECADRTSFDGV